MKLGTGDKVKIVNSTDANIDGQSGTIVGWHNKMPIVLFDTKPFERDIAVVITIYCLEKI